MRKSSLLIIAYVASTIFFFSSIYADGEENALFPISEGEKWGYIDRDGKVVIEPQFDRAFEFSEGLAVVWKDGVCGYIDQNGKMAIEAIFETCEDFSEGLAVIGVRIGGMTYGYVDKTGKVIIKPRFDDARRFSEGLAFVQESLYRPKFDGSPPFPQTLKTSREVEMVTPRAGFIDKTGEFVVPLSGFDATCDDCYFSDGLALVHMDGKFGYIDQTGKFVIKPKFEIADRFSEG